jgi:hypothetical protein
MIYKIRFQSRYTLEQIIFYGSVIIFLSFLNESPRLSSDSCLNNNTNKSSFSKLCGSFCLFQI